MKIGVSSLFAITKGFNFLLKRLEPHLGGFEVLEVLDEGATRLTEDKVRMLRDVAKTSGLKLCLHAPFIDVNVASLNPYMRKTALKHLSRSLVKAFKLECLAYVVHGGTYIHPRVKDRAYRLAISSINKLALLAKDLGVRLALENGPAINNFLFTEAKEFVEAIRKGLDDWVGLCLDVGHANIARQVEAFTEEAGGLISHVHAHDNDGQRDLHLNPGEGTVNWRELLKGLARRAFSGVVVVETSVEPWRGLGRIRGWISRVEA